MIAAFQADVKVENIKLYLRIRWFIILGIFLLNVFENLTGLLSVLQVLVVYVSCLVSIIPALFLAWAIARNKLVEYFTHLCLALDITIMVLSLYFHGGVENTWLFLPVFVIFLAAYIFGFWGGIFYAFCSYAAVLTMAVLQYLAIVPYFPLFELPVRHWRSIQYLVDNMTGMLLLYFASAFAIGSLATRAAQMAEKISEYKGKLNAVNLDGASAREKIRQATVEIMVKSAEVERLLATSAEQQLHLIDLKKELEQLRRKSSG